VLQKSTPGFVIGGGGFKHRRETELLAEGFRGYPQSLDENSGKHHHASDLFLLPLLLKWPYFRKLLRYKILKGSDDGVSHSELLDFWTLSIVRYSKN
jgi:hypothetical protein